MLTVANCSEEEMLSIVCMKYWLASATVTQRDGTRVESMQEKEDAAYQDALSSQGSMCRKLGADGHPVHLPPVRLVAVVEH